MPRLQIEALERIQFKREMGGPMHAGDRRTFEEPEQVAEAESAIRAGWAKDMAGAIETGQRTIIGRVVQPHNSASDTTATEVN
jgi:hypothetical protein